MNERLNIEKLVVALFKKIRDMPFETKLNRGDYNENLIHIKTRRRGSCTPKHYLLGLLCEKLELSVTYLTYPFYWENQPFLYPKHIKDIIERLPIAYHLALNINIEGKDFFLDATWDPPLEKAGFPINEINETLRDTKIAVVQTGECIIHKDPLTRDFFVRKALEEKASTTNEEIAFYDNLFNQWLENIRKS